MSNQIAHDLDSKTRTDDIAAQESVTFEDILVSDFVLSGLKKSGFHKPSPIQLKAIPLGRCGFDLVVQAKSGTGKTCVFSVIALDSIDAKSAALQVIVLAPTREIALQIHEVVSTIGQDIEQLSVQVFIGGTLVSEDRQKAKRCHIAIGSPGRIKQLISLGVLAVNNVRLFVLDEADKLVEEGGLQQQINWIYSSLPSTKQMLALSATYPEALAKFLTKYMQQPTFVRLNPTDPSLLGLKQYYLLVKECKLPHQLFEEKTRCIIEILSSMTYQQALLFSNYHTRAETLCNALNSSGWRSTFISGNMEQWRRTEAITRLKSYQCRILISTDLTSRGIDAQNVDVVINMDVPTDWETYMHRIGRAGRFGAYGTAVSLVSPGVEASRLHAIAAQCNASIAPLPADFRAILNDQKSNVKLQENLNENFKSVNSRVKISCPNLQENLNEQLTSVNNVEISCPNLRLQVKNEHGDSELSADTTRTSDSFVGSEKYIDTVTMQNDRAKQSYPVIDSLQDVMQQSACLSQNLHYLDMNYKELVADFEYFKKNGIFLAPPKKLQNEEQKTTNEIELKLDDITKKVDQNLKLSDLSSVNGSMKNEAVLNKNSGYALRVKCKEIVKSEHTEKLMCSKVKAEQATENKETVNFTAKTDSISETTAAKLEQMPSKCALTRITMLAKVTQRFLMKMMTVQKLDFNLMRTFLTPTLKKKIKFSQSVNYHLKQTVNIVCVLRKKYMPKICT
uniref:probable ATP-dependent RNA helicase DDX20 isoform X2 n=1 Tax=Ciona intestinalis TaxID=7719 RepID=UPI00089DCDBB|nr:probable ATP-dependent RNA helicase DDX20 isoform X2 [Ciona intestinalis]|eukprot:XP_018667845.1 probable ATP-dependent RNA helicase DDX20 isoform X2 [Ciona intestinalis]